eukprot:Gregarina_sp_Poly_1__126@NODE_1029_length_5298_cov_113_426114_g55_i1_p2_GENE_NODE_1029_length_5298_cov_113_426114_g55_i1NODE_1029_length_5298_cov_113_426114_g55_i1_p2_ORF_typecomplete_len556_score65_30_NODE_1029_length_5298_cov_113_426114_g55_i135095176
MTKHTPPARVIQWLSQKIETCEEKVRLQKSKLKATTNQFWQSAPDPRSYFSTRRKRRRQPTSCWGETPSINKQPGAAEAKPPQKSSDAEFPSMLATTTAGSESSPLPVSPPPPSQIQSSARRPAGGHVLQTRRTRVCLSPNRTRVCPSPNRTRLYLSSARSSSNKNASNKNAVPRAAGRLQSADACIRQSTGRIDKSWTAEDGEVKASRISDLEVTVTQRRPSTTHTVHSYDMDFWVKKETVDLMHFKREAKEVIDDFCRKFGDACLIERRYHESPRLCVKLDRSVTFGKDELTVGTARTRPHTSISYPTRLLNLEVTPRQCRRPAVRRDTESSNLELPCQSSLDSCDFGDGHCGMTYREMHSLSKSIPETEARSEERLAKNVKEHSADNDVFSLTLDDICCKDINLTATIKAFPQAHEETDQISLEKINGSTEQLKRIPTADSPIECESEASVEPLCGEAFCGRSAYDPALPNLSVDFDVPRPSRVTRDNNQRGIMPNKIDHEKNFECNEFARNEFASLEPIPAETRMRMNRRAIKIEAFTQLDNQSHVVNKLL